MLLCFRILATLYAERGVLTVVAEDKVGGIEERLLGGVESDGETSISEKSVKVDMALEDATTDGANLSNMLERRLRTVNSVKVDTDDSVGGVSRWESTECPLRMISVDGEDGDGRQDGPYISLFLGGFVGVDCALDAAE